MVRTTITLYVEGAGSVDSLAADEGSGLIYWVDRQKRIINLASMLHQLRTSLPTGNMTRPHAIALDVTQRSLYISQIDTPPTIERCLQDGHDCTTVVTQRLVRPDTLTVSRDHLYWTDSGSGDISALNIHTHSVTHYAV
ncbi:low-density lipoprotein receptor [Plakobranchus ocellatus]|uniref:Low-density lipoprotein receptor n=1 Tax=Plakobranchus ocellatus TaxID=259542 RepID=A0AAV4B8J0_9GAST|nr:low-density lipoprotein receptor [Plakobranchus ocellatus]